jgi:hypothetical protein
MTKLFSASVEKALEDYCGSHIVDIFIPSFFVTGIFEREDCFS